MTDVKELEWKIKWKQKKTIIVCLIVSLSVVVVSGITSVIVSTFYKEIEDIYKLAGAGVYAAWTGVLAMYIIFIFLCRVLRRKFNLKDEGAREFLGSSLQNDVWFGFWYIVTVALFVTIVMILNNYLFIYRNFYYIVFALLFFGIQGRPLFFEFLERRL